MKFKFIIIIALNIFSISACQHNVLPLAAEDTKAKAEINNLPKNIEIVNSVFGIFKKDKSGNPIFLSTKNVNYKVKQQYGWIIEFKDKNPPVKWREELILPSAPKTWGKNSEAKHEISADKKVSITEKVETPYKNIISNSWVIAKGDPKGPYIIKVSIEDKEPIIFEFNVR